MGVTCEQEVNETRRMEKQTEKMMEGKRNRVRDQILEDACHPIYIGS